MPELSDRDRYEREAEKAFLAVLVRYRDEEDVDWVALSRWIREALFPPLTGAFKAAAEQLAGVTGQAIAAEALGRRAETWAARQARTVADQTTTTIRQRLQKGLSSAEAFSAAGGRASGVAATETTRALIAGEALLLSWLDVEARSNLVPIWFTEEDGRVCSVCGPLHDQPKQIWARVSSSGPPAHPRCRCSLEYRSKKAI